MSIFIMKMKILYLFLLFAFLTTSTGNVFATDIKLDIKGQKQFKLNEKVASPQLVFISEAPMEDIEGSVETKVITSSISLDPSNIENATGTISFKVEGMRTGISTRDKHLRSEMWLDAEKYPIITFDLNKLEKVKVKTSGKGKSVLSGQAVGTFKMRGKDKNIKAPVSITYLKESAATKKKASGDLIFFEGSFELALADYDVAGKKGIIGEKVGETIKIKFKLFYSQIKN